MKDEKEEIIKRLREMEIEIDMKRKKDENYEKYEILENGNENDIRLAHNSDKYKLYEIIKENKMNKMRKEQNILDDSKTIIKEPIKNDFIPSSILFKELTPEDINDKVNHWLEINKEEINELKNKKGNIYMFK